MFLHQPKWSRQESRSSTGRLPQFYSILHFSCVCSDPTTLWTTTELELSCPESVVCTVLLKESREQERVCVGGQSSLMWLSPRITSTFRDRNWGCESGVGEGSLANKKHPLRPSMTRIQFSGEWDVCRMKRWKKDVCGLMPFKTRTVYRLTHGERADVPHSMPDAQHTHISLTVAFSQWQEQGRGLHDLIFYLRLCVSAARIVKSRQWCEMTPCSEGEICGLLFNHSGWTCTKGGGRIKTVTVRHSLLLENFF